MYALLLSLSLLAAEEESTVALRGIVKDSAGKPVAGVMVLAPYQDGEQDRSKQAETNDEGEFALSGVTVVNDFVRLLAYKPGHALGGLVLDSESRAKPVVITLAATEPVMLTILNSEGKPVSGAEVSAPDYEQDGSWRVAPKWTKALMRTADADGHVTIDYLPAKSSFIATVSAQGYGIQRRQVTTEPTSHTIRLRPAGRLEGKVIAADAMAAANVAIVVYSTSGSPVDAAGYAQIKTDAEGRFVIPHLAEGEARLSIQVDRSRPFRTTGESKTTVVAGKTASLEIPLVKAARVTGKVVEQGTQKPIARVKLFLSNGTESEQVVTNADGSFAVYFGPGSVHGNIGEAPRGYFSSPFLLNIGGQIGPDTKELALKTIELSPSLEREVAVVDEEGNPAADAWVDATWVLRHDRYTTIVTRSATTDAQGKCQLELLPETAEIYLRASTNERAGDAVATTVGAPTEIRITVAADKSAVLAGRVVDQAGKPVAKAFVQVQSGEYRAKPRGYEGDFGTQWMLTTDDQGRFQSPHPLPRNLPWPPSLTSFRSDSGYLITVKAAGKLDSRVRFPLGEGKSPMQMPDIVLEEAKRVVGRVISDDGRPIEGAQIQAEGPDPTRPALTRSAVDGAFELAGVHPRARFFFARHSEFRFTGMPISTGELTVIMERAGAKGAPLEPLHPMAEAQRDAVRKVLVPVYENHGAKLHPAQRFRILELLVRLDPEYVLGELPKVEDPYYRAQLLIGLDQLEDAEAAATASKNAWNRAYGLLLVSRAHGNPIRRRELLAEVLLHAKGVIEPDRRLSLAMNVAEELFDLGDAQAAKHLVDEHLKEIEALEAGFYRGYLAETVALFDVDKALKLCEGATDEFERDRHPGNIAHELAAIDPARAEAILKTLSQQGLYRYVPRVAYRMAAEDLPRAQRIAEMIPPTYPDQRQHAQGLIALAIAGKDPGEARRLLDQIFAALDGDSSRYQSRSLIASTMALVHLSETIDPAATREYLWRTIALFPSAPESPDDWSRQQQRQNEAKAAILLLRYGLHPEVAREMVEPLFATEGFKSHDPNLTAAFYAMALTDAAQSAVWLEKYIGRTKEDELKYIPQPWELMAEALGSDNQGFWNSLHERVLHLWVVDKEDL